MCFTVFFLHKPRSGFWHFRKLAFLGRRFNSYSVNIGRIKKHIKFKSYLYVVITSALLVFLFCLESKYSIIAAMFGFTFGRCHVFWTWSCGFYGGLIILGNVIGALLVPQVYSAFPADFDTYRSDFCTDHYCSRNPNKTIEGNHRVCWTTGFCSRRELQ